MKQNANITGIGEQLSIQGTTINPALIAAANTNITDLFGNPRQLPNPAQTLRPAIGKERVLTQQLVPIKSETSDGQSVYGVLNDESKRIRFVGDWGVFLDTHGPRIESTKVNAFVEVTFRGTGLNILTLPDSAGRDLRVSVDGGGEGSNIMPMASGVIQGRKYPQNAIINAVSGLTYGTHTVKLRVNASAVTFFGFEILNESSQIKVPSGELLKDGKKYTLSSEQSFSYNTGFYNNPSLNGRGGRVSIYILPNGTLGKAIQQANASAAYLTNANHINEEPVANHSYRQFGISRGDDFDQVYTTPVNVAFTLDDGSTSLIGYTVRSITGEVLNPGSVGSSYLTINFIGTGLDVIRQDDGNSGTNHGYSVEVDGTVVGSYSNAASTTPRIEKLVSGLPYGSHVVKLLNTASPAQNVSFKGFIVYQPKKPTLPDGAVEVAEYGLVGDYSGGSAGLNTIASGVIRKNTAYREAVYKGSWAFDQSGLATYVNGNETYTNTSGDKFEYVFFGTGFEFKSRARTSFSNNISVELQNLSTGGSLLALTTANFPSLQSAAYGGFSFSSGTLNQALSNTDGSGFSAYDLPLGLYKVVFTQNTGSSFVVECLDIITPIHAHKRNGGTILQNVASIGSSAMNLTTKFEKASLHKNKVLCLGVDVNPSTSNTSPVGLHDMLAPIWVEGDEIKISYHVQSSNNTAGGISSMRVMVDGILVGQHKNNVFQAGGAGSSVTTSDSLNVKVSPGLHLVQIQFWTNAGIHYQLSGAARTLLVEEV